MPASTLCVRYSSREPGATLGSTLATWACAALICVYCVFAAADAAVLPRAEAPLYAASVDRVFSSMSAAILPLLGSFGVLRDWPGSPDAA